MKLSSPTLSLIIFCSLGFVLSLPANVIRNGDFTSGLQGWVISRPNQPILTASDAAGFYRRHSGGVMIDVNALASGERRPNTVSLSQFINEVEADTTYTLTFETRLPRGEKISFGFGTPVRTGPNRGNLGGGIVLTEITGTGDWSRSEITFVWKPSEDSTDAPSLQFRIGLTSEAGFRRVNLTRQP